MTSDSAAEPPASHSSAAQRLLLFDIDGTILTSGGAGEQALRESLKQGFQIEDDLATIEIAGRTDSGIARAIFARHQIEVNPGNLAIFLDGYLHHLAAQMLVREGRLLPGILPLLGELRKRSNLHLGLLTGNLEQGARIKLTHFGVWEFFEFGAFADDHHDRNELGPFARRRARERKGIEFEPQNIDVIGDTPHDVACGRAIGARTIGIATGNYTAQALRDCGADFVFDDLSDTARVLKLLGWE
jgi:phosphoglycolate phosphatase